MTFPDDRSAKRRALLDAVERVRPVLVARADEAEAAATLPVATVAALEESGLFRLKLAAVLGGAEADPMTQMEVIEAVARIDAAAAWCVMIGATTIAFPGAFLPDEAIAKVFAGGRVPKAAGVFMPGGEAVPVDGGYRVTGRWAFASGVRHAEWVTGAALVTDPDGSVRTRVKVVMPAGSVEIHDNWQAAGLKGTGSCDYSVSGLFVPEEFSWDMERARPQRGGPLYRLGLPAFVANEHAAFACGVARRALDAVTELAVSKRRGIGKPSVLASRASFQRLVGECELRLASVRALAVAVNERAWQLVCAGEVVPPALHAELRGIATLATDVAVDITTRAFRVAGGGALYQSSVLQRCWRDVSAAGQHFMVSDSAYESLGQFRLGQPDAHPMG